MAEALLREKLTCSICLELYKRPVTTSCGHSFCWGCIEQHWDKEQREMEGPGQAGDRGYSCPECRHSEPQRPQLEHSVVLSKITEVLWGSPEGEATGSGEEQDTGPHPLVHLQPGDGQGVQALCRRHGRLLELYCIQEQRCICCECTVHECKDHNKALTRVQRRGQEEPLRETLLKTKHQLESTEAEILKVEEKAKYIKETSSKFIAGIADRFSQLHRTLEQCEALAKEAVCDVERGALEQAAANQADLQCRRDTLVQHRQQAERLLGSLDDVAFLEGLALLPSPGSSAALPVVEFPVSEKVGNVLKVLSQVSKLLQDDLANSLHAAPTSKEAKESLMTKTPSSVKQEPSRLPELELRVKLCKDYRNLTFDPNTANRYLKLSRQNRRVKNMPSPDEQRPEHPGRFETWQVLSCESFQEGSHYWEVQISDYFVYLGVAYGEIDRKKKDRRTSTIGRNESSWSLQVQRNSHIAWHNGQEQKLAAPLYKYIGVHLDCSAGTLSLYGIGDQMELLHTFPCVFSAPVFPAFWIGEGVDATLVHQKSAAAPSPQK